MKKQAKNSKKVDHIISRKQFLVVDNRLTNGIKNGLYGPKYFVSKEQGRDGDKT